MYTTRSAFAAMPVTTSSLRCSVSKKPRRPSSLLLMEGLGQPNIGSMPSSVLSIERATRVHERYYLIVYTSYVRLHSSTLLRANQRARHRQVASEGSLRLLCLFLTSFGEGREDS